MYRYCLFDLDGTLTDPREGITKCVQYALHHYGIEEPDLAKLECFIGPPLADSFMEFYHFPEERALFELGIQMLSEKDRFSQCAMVGDRKFDMTGAKAHGVTAIGVSFGFAQEGELEKAGADFIADSITELQELLL